MARIQFHFQGKRIDIKSKKITEIEGNRWQNWIKKIVFKFENNEPFDAEDLDIIKKLQKGPLGQRLAKIGLIEQPSGKRPAESNLEALSEAFLDERKSVKDSTKTAMRTGFRRMVKFFGDKPVRRITPADCEKYREHLGGSLSQATTARSLIHAKMLFKYFVKLGIILENPFADLGMVEHPNEERRRFIDRATIDAVLKACPDSKWRLIVALGRYGGLRIPSELVSMEWKDIFFDRGRFLVKSPKTEGKGKASRLVPLFPELKEHFEEHRRAGNRSSGRVFEEMDSAINLRTSFLKIIKKTGIAPWEKIFQNLRSSRATEIVRNFPIHVAGKWLGHSAQVCLRNYLTVTEEDFLEASFVKAVGDIGLGEVSGVGDAINVAGSVAEGGKTSSKSSSASSKSSSPLVFASVR